MESGLSRSINLPTLVLYGMGTMVGGGIYALVGKIAGEAGFFTPFIFIISAITALLTAISYARLSSLFPVAAGPAKYVSQAFGIDSLGVVIALLVMFTGLSSASTLINATGGFLFDLANIPPLVGTLSVILILGGIAYRGIGLSAIMIAGITLIEVTALIYLLVINADQFAHLDIYINKLKTSISAHENGIYDQAFLGLIGSTAFLAFYAFIGFEDMVNVVEEVKKPCITMPLGILIAFLLTTILYLGISYVAVMSVPLDALGAAKTPLSLLVDKELIISPKMMGVISLIAGVNGALVQWIMISRVLYGVSEATKKSAFSKIFKLFRQTHPVYKTPNKAIILTGLVIFIASNLFDIVSLAQAASAIIIVVFIGVNSSLILIEVKSLFAAKEKSTQEECSNLKKILLILNAIFGALACLLLLSA